MNKCELIIFDWSGVISDDRMPVYQANMKLLENYGKPTVSFDEWLPETVMTVVHFARKHGIVDSENKIQNKHAQYLNEAEESGTTPFMVPGAKEILELLKKKDKKIALLSSHPPENIKKEMEGYGLQEYFDSVLGGSTDKVTSLIEICLKFSIIPELSAYVGDMISDIQSAKAANLLSVGIYSGYHMKEVLEKENPDYLIEDISKIIEIIQ